jgi:small subunit ribosomal protein S2
MEATATESVRTDVTVKDLLEAGLHFGHQTKRWNPKMKRFIFGERNGIYIIDLEKTLAKLQEAKGFIQNTIRAGRSILFVGTKKQAQDAVRETATATGQPYIVTRWLGGTLTNNRTIRQSVARMRKLEEMDKNGSLDKLPKKEVASLRHELKKLQSSFGGIADMTDMPGALFIVDISCDDIAVQEANRMHIPIISIVDTNTNPELIQYPIPGNDDAIRAIRLILKDIQDAIAGARDEYTRSMQEQAQRKAILDAEVRAKTKAVEDERKARDRDSRKARTEAIAKIKAKPAVKPRAPKAAQTEAAPDAPAPDAPEAEAKT